MLDGYLLEAIKGKTRIGDLTCPKCGDILCEGVVENDVMQMICCGVAFEPMLVVKASSEASIRLLPKTGKISLDVFNAFVAFSISLPPCPKCEKVLEFCKDASDTKKPHCCGVFFTPSGFQEAERGAYELRFCPKPLDSPYVEIGELRSLSLTAYRQQVATFKAGYVTSISNANLNIKQGVNTADMEVSDAHLPSAEASDTGVEMSDEDIAIRFLETYIHIDKKHFETNKAIYTWYQYFVGTLGRAPLRDQDLYKLLQERYNTAEYKRKRINGKQFYGFIGIRCIPKVDA